MKDITIIGGGNMGQAFAEGLAGSSLFGTIIVADPTFRKSDKKNRQITFLQDNREAVAGTKTVILAVKPQILPEVLSEIKDVLPKDALVISIAAGISIGNLEKILGKQAIVRVMPNICAKIGESMSVWVKNKRVSNNQIVLVKKILGSIGTECELGGEELIDGATAISGSGPAYLFYLAECISEEAEKLGLPSKVADKLVRQTLFGSAKMLKGDSRLPAELRASVTSKGGTTEAAFREFESHKLAQTVSKGIQAAARRAKELNK